MIRQDPPGLALVTGASSGIGAAFARALRSRGWRLVLVARRADRLQDLGRELGGEPHVWTIPLDLSVPDAAERLREAVEHRGLAIELLVNNAGLGHAGPFHESPTESVHQIVDVNVRALVTLTRAFLPGMIERGRGRLINVVSTSAFQPVPYLALYAASKAFVLSFTEAIATELRHTPIVVQALCPGLTQTEFQQIAGTDRVAFNRGHAMAPEEVVAYSLDALERERPTRVIPGWSNRLLAGLQAWMPRGLVLRVGAWLFRPRP